MKSAPHSNDWVTLLFAVHALLLSLSLVKSASYTLVLSTGSFVAMRAGIASAATELLLWGTLTLTSLIIILFLLRNLQPAR